MNLIVNSKEQFFAEEQLLTFKSGKIEVDIFHKALLLASNIVFLEIGHIVLIYLI